MMDNLKKLYESEDLWKSNMGGLVLGEKAFFRSKDVFVDLKDWDWVTMQYYCVTGKEPNQNSAKFLNSLSNRTLAISLTRITW